MIGDPPKPKCARCGAIGPLLPSGRWHREPDACIAWIASELRTLQEHTRGEEVSDEEIRRQHVRGLIEELGAMKGIDPEKEHSRADEILSGMLRWLGHNELVDAYDKVMKWYA